MSKIPVFDLSAAEALDPANPSERARKLWSMVFLLAIKDMATVVRYEPHRGSRALSYQVSGVYQSMVPPPKQVSRELVDELARMLAVTGPHGPFAWLDRLLPWRQETRIPLPYKALLELKVGDDTVDSIVTLDANDLGPSVVVYLIDTTPEFGPRSEASDKAVRMFRRMFAAKSKERGDELHTS
jgi:hypothetical protein